MPKDKGREVERKKPTEQDSEDPHESNAAAENQELVIGERRRRVASLLAQSRTEAEIATSLDVSQSTISRDIQALKEESGKFIQELAKSDLVFSYQQSIRGIEEVKRKLWDRVNSDENGFTPRDKLMAFRLIMIAEETRFRLLEKGPMMLSYEAVTQKVNQLEKEARGPNAGD